VDLCLKVGCLTIKDGYGGEGSHSKPVELGKLNEVGKSPSFSAKIGLLSFFVPEN